MPTISRATIKSYDAATHKATVQIAGSLAVWLDAVPVSAAIVPADVLAGRECGVIFFTDDNPNDAAVVTVYNTPAPYSAHLLRDRDTDTYVDVEQTADVDEIRHVVGGTLRWLLAGANPHGTLTGDAYITSTLIVGPLSSGPGVAGYQALVENTAPGTNALVGLGVYVGTGNSAPGNTLVGIVGKAFLETAPSSQSIYGLDFQAGVTGLGSGAATVATLAAMRLTLAAISSSGITVTNGYGIDLQTNSYAASIAATTTLRGVYVRASSTNKVATVRGVQVDAWSGATTAFNPFYDVGFASTRDADGNRFRMNTMFGSVTGSFGGGDGVIGLTNATTNPSANPANGVVIWANGATGDVKMRGAGGQVCLIPTGGAPNVVGAKGGNAALASLCTALAGLGLIVDGTTA